MCPPGALRNVVCVLPERIVVGACLLSGVCVCVCVARSVLRILGRCGVEDVDVSDGVDVCVCSCALVAASRSLGSP